MDPTGNTPAERENTQVSKWAAIRYAVRDWGTTFRLCMICVVIEAPVVAWTILRH